MSELKGNVQTETQLEAQPVQETRTFNWTVKLFERQGRCWLAWSTDAPFRAQQGRVCLYANSFPSDPTNAVSWTWDDVGQPNPFNTGQLWGSGWCAAYIAQASPNGPYVYFLQTPLTSEG
jgi:hypothetical protein